MDRSGWVRWIGRSGVRLVGARWPMMILVVVLWLPFVVVLDRGVVTDPLDRLGLILAGALVGLGVSRLRRWAGANLLWYDRLRVTRKDESAPDNESESTDHEE